MTDIVLTEDENPGSLIVHRVLDCWLVQQHRAQDRPIMTMLGCAKPLPSHLKEHRCVKGIAR